MDLIGAAGHLPDGPYRGMHHDCVAGRDAQAAKPGGQFLS